MALDRLIGVLNDPDSSLVAVSVSMKVAMAARQISRKDIPDLPDRIVAATALHLGIPLVTRDRQIQRARLDTVW